MNKTIKWIYALAFMLFSVAADAQSVKFGFSSGYNVSSPAKSVVEKNITDLLNALQNANKKSGVVALESVNMEPRAKTRLVSLWGNCPFVCEDLNNVFACINDVEGYQVRGIPVEMKPQDNLYKGELHRELVISFNKRGVITGVSLAMNGVNASKIMGEGKAVKEVSERRMIMKFLEDFRCYYNEKDTAALRAIYSDDAVIITGSVVSRKAMGDISTNKVEIRYNKQNKEQYMQSLKNCFRRNKYINVDFDKIDVVKHPSREGYYGVTLHQKWESSTYGDEGWLFLLWDFRDPEKPMIHVRTWQPNLVDDSAVFTIDDFRLD